MVEHVLALGSTLLPWLMFLCLFLPNYKVKCNSVQDGEDKICSLICNILRTGTVFPLFSKFDLWEPQRETDFWRFFYSFWGWKVREGWMQFIWEEQSKWQLKNPKCLKINSGYWHLSNTELLKRDKNVHQQLFDFPESPPFYEGKPCLCLPAMLIMMLSALHSRLKWWFVLYSWKKQIKKSKYRVGDQSFVLLDMDWGFCIVRITGFLF